MTVASRLLSLGTLSLVAVLICSFQATPVTALSLEVAHGARSMHSRSHDALAKRKRSDKRSKRCKPRPAPSSSAPSSSSKPAPTSAKASPTSEKASPAPAPSQSPNNNQGGSFLNGRPHKIGLGWPNGGAEKMDPYKAVSFVYTWSPSPPPQAQELGIPFCPMLWGYNQVQQFDDEVNKNPPKCVMGMNEPEISSQSNISPQDGAAMWNQHILPLKQKYGTTLVGPATTSDPGGKRWMQDFFKACEKTPGDKCGMDLMAAHWYDTTAEKLIAYLTDNHNTFGMDIVLTEFACHNFNGGPQPSQGEVWAFQAAATSFLDATPWIKAWTPFGTMKDLQGVDQFNALMKPDGSPTDLWWAYANA